MTFEDYKKIQQQWTTVNFDRMSSQNLLSWKIHYALLPLGDKILDMESYADMIPTPKEISKR